jgi:hypothetical protein
MWRRNDKVYVVSTWLQKLRNDMAIPASEATIRPNSRRRRSESFIGSRGIEEGHRGDKSLCLITDGYLGMDTNAAMVSDQICNSLGRDVSDILRPDEGRTTHSLVGEACVLDFMHDEALELGL